MFKKRSAPKMMRKMMAEMAAPDAFMDEAVECSAAAPMMDVDREKEVVGGVRLHSCTCLMHVPEMTAVRLFA